MPVIKDVEGTELKAACSFQYKGFEVSLSTIFKGATVGVNKIGSGDWGDFNTVEEAFAYIESQQPAIPKGELSITFYADNQYYYIVDGKSYSYNELRKHSYSISMRSYCLLCMQGESVIKDDVKLKILLEELHSLMVAKII